MDPHPSLMELRARWNDVLDALERRDRMAWIVFFDARLASLEGSVLKLDFSDATKFASGFDYAQVRDRHRLTLTDSINEIYGIELQIATS